MTPEEIDKLAADVKAATLRFGNRAAAIRAYQSQIESAWRTAGLAYVSRQIGCSRAAIQKALSVQPPKLPTPKSAPHKQEAHEQPPAPANEIDPATLAALTTPPPAAPPAPPTNKDSINAIKGYFKNDQGKADR